MNDTCLLEVDRGLVVAPAGCGKTHLITEAIKKHVGSKPILVLTHTNAGVAALRQRLKKMDAPSSNFRLATIDGWAIRVINSFPNRSEYLDGPSPQRPNYKRIRKAAWTLLKTGHINDILIANYDRVLVDEYQDCSYNQHGIIYFLAKNLPTCVLGDPLQAIFGFGNDPLADWNEHVCKHFPLAFELTTPWRWVNAENKELGEWVLDVRKRLVNGDPIDLSKAPDSVEWVQLKQDKDDHQRLIKAARCSHMKPGDKVLVIGDSLSAQSRYKIAKSVPGTTTVEPVDLKDLVAFAKNLDLTDGHSLSETLGFASDMITNVNSSLLIRRVQTIKAGREKTPPSDIENAALDFEKKPSLEKVADILSRCSNQTGSRTFRPSVLRACLRAISTSVSTPDLSFHESAIMIREENRALGRQLPNRAIGSTLLLKGLEADHVVVLNADSLDAANLYVGITRGAKSITICSQTNVLNPS